MTSSTDSWTEANAYEYAEAGVRPILEANPTIEVAIDLHRDGVGRGDTSCDRGEWKADSEDHVF